MPTYDYHCPTCGTMEVFHGMRDVLARCPECRATDEVGFRKVVTIPQMIVQADWSQENKGRGRYISQLSDPHGLQGPKRKVYAKTPKDAWEHAKRAQVNFEKD